MTLLVWISFKIMKTYRKTSKNRNMGCYNFSSDNIWSFTGCSLNYRTNPNCHCKDNYFKQCWRNYFWMALLEKGFRICNDCSFLLKKFIPQVNCIFQIWACRDYSYWNSSPFFNFFNESFNFSRKL